MPKVIEFRRHARRSKGEDALSPEGRTQAEDLGRMLSEPYVFVFVSPAQRAAETVAWILRGSGRKLPPHALVPGLATDHEERWRVAAGAAGSSRIDALAEADAELVTQESARLRALVDELFDRSPETGLVLAVGHSPLIEAAVYGLTGRAIEPLAELEGVRIIRGDGGADRVEELRGRHA